MPPQQCDRLLHFIDDMLDFGAHWLVFRVEAAGGAGGAATL